MSPWYDLRGWLGVKQQLSIYLSLKISFVLLWRPNYIMEKLSPHLHIFITQINIILFLTIKCEQN